MHIATRLDMLDTELGSWRMVKMILSPLVGIRLMIYSGRLKYVNLVRDTFTRRSGQSWPAMSTSSFLSIIRVVCDRDSNYIRPIAKSMSRSIEEKYKTSTLYFLPWKWSKLPIKKSNIWRYIFIWYFDDRTIYDLQINNLFQLIFELFQKEKFLKFFTR